MPRKSPEEQVAGRFRIGGDSADQGRIRFLKGPQQQPRGEDVNHSIRNITAVTIAALVLTV